MLKDIPEYEGLYYADADGNIYNKNLEKLKLCPCRKGYLSVSLYKDKKMKRFRVHRLIMLTFVGKSDLSVNHKDFNKKNNTLKNLEYLSVGENLKYSRDNDPNFFVKFRGTRKVSDSDKDKIINLKKNGLSYREIKEKLRVGGWVVWDTLKKENLLKDNNPSRKYPRHINKSKSKFYVKINNKKMNYYSNGFDDLEDAIKDRDDFLKIFGDK